MSKTAIRIIPYGNFDIPGLEGWLEKLAGKGLRYSSAFGPLMLFDRAEPQQVQVHLEPIQGKAAEDPELNALYEAAGWDYWGMFRNGFFVYATGDPSAQAHTDRETWDYALKRFFRQALTGGLLLALLNVLFLSLYHKGAIWDIDWTWMRYFPVESLSDGATLPFLLCLAAFALLDLNYLLGLVQLAEHRFRGVLHLVCLDELVEGPQQGDLEHPQQDHRHQGEAPKAQEDLQVDSQGAAGGTLPLGMKDRGRHHSTSNR